MNIDTVIQTALDKNNIKSEVITKKFKYHSEIDHTLDGIYVLIQDEQVMYVGKGKIHDRLRKHWKKANGKLLPTDPPGWHWLYKNVTINPSEWIVKYLILDKQTKLSLIEGCLIHDFQPLANNETYIDEGRSIE
jgi:hypothetical protein